MKLYEVRTKPGYRIPGKTEPAQTWFVSNFQDANQVFTNQVKLMKAYDQFETMPAVSEVWLSKIDVNTNLNVADWIRLLEGDAPGPKCDLTPVDLINKESRETLKHWISDHGGKQ